MTDVVSIDIEAPPEKVWALVTDVTRMGEWSPECFKCSWVGGATGPVLGAKFRGWNKQGVVRWATTSRVTECVPNERFTFHVPLSGATWGYRFDQVGGGTHLTETHEMSEGGGAAAKLFIRVFLGGTAHREQLFEPNMRETLDRIKQAAES